MRGGTSKGVFFHARDLPTSRAEIDPILLGVLGSPDPYGRQLDGMGGGISSLSKAVIVGPPTRDDCDIDYTFAQISVDRPVVDWSANCGNLSSAVGPFAVDEGLVRVQDGEACIRIHQVNTRKVIEARFPVMNAKAAVKGEFVLPGVAGTGARIRLDFLDPGGAATGRLLPTGRVIDELEVDGEGTLAASLVDATNPLVVIEANAVGLAGTETPDEIEARPGLMRRLDRIRRVAGVAMGLAESPEGVGLANPKIALVARPTSYSALDGTMVDAGQHSILVRMVSMERLHRAVALTAGMCLGVAARIEGTLVHQHARGIESDEIRVGHPSGVLAVGGEVAGNAAQGWHAVSAVVYRTARRLMQGEVAVPA